MPKLLIKPANADLKKDTNANVNIHSKKNKELYKIFRDIAKVGSNTQSLEGLLTDSKLISYIETRQQIITLPAAQNKDTKEYKSAKPSHRSKSGAKHRHKQPRKGAINYYLHLALYDFKSVKTALYLLKKLPQLQKHLSLYDHLLIRKIFSLCKKTQDVESLASFCGYPQVKRYLNHYIADLIYSALSDSNDAFLTFIMKQAQHLDKNEILINVISKTITRMTRLLESNRVAANIGIVAINLHLIIGDFCRDTTTFKPHLQKKLSLLIDTMIKYTEIIDTDEQFNIFSQHCISICESISKHKLLDHLGYRDKYKSIIETLKNKKFNAKQSRQCQVVVAKITKIKRSKAKLPCSILQFPDGYKIVLTSHKIGSGGFGVVKLGQQYESKDGKVEWKDVAVKIYGRPTHEYYSEGNLNPKNIINEANMNRSLGRKVHLGKRADSQKYYLIMPYYQGDTLDKIICELMGSKGGRFSRLDDRIRIAISILEQVSLFHSKSITIGDLSPDNIIIDWYRNATIIDLGGAKRKGASYDELGQQYKELFLHVQTLKKVNQSYASPQFSFATDMHAVAIIFSMLFATSQIGVSYKYYEYKNRSICIKPIYTTIHLKEYEGIRKLISALYNAKSTKWLPSDTIAACAKLKQFDPDVKGQLITQILKPRRLARRQDI